MLAACLALCAGAVSAATKYVVPWEVNPTLSAEISVVNANDVAVTNVTPVSLDFSADGAWLAASVTSDATGARTVLTLPMTDLALYTDGTARTPSVSATATSLGFSAAPLVVAAGAGRGATLALDCANGVAKSLPNGACRDWTGRAVPNAVTVSGDGLASVAALDLAADGETAVSCTGTSGVLTKWTLAGDSAAALTLTQTETTFDTGLSKVSSVAVYTVGKPNAEKATYAVVGEADASAETKGQVKIVRISSDATGASLPTGVTTLVDDAANLGGGIVAVRMSCVDTYRPRLYVLTADGAIRCYCLMEDLTIKMASYVYTNAELLTAAGAPFADAGASARVTAFAVSADGGTLVLGYAKTADDVEATDAMRLAVLRHTPRTWTAYSQNAANNPAVNKAACISDGRWVLQIYWPGGGHGIGSGPWVGNSAYLTNDCTDEFLDLSSGYDGSTPLVALGSCALGWKNGDSTRTWTSNHIARVFLLPPMLNNISQMTKNWEGVEEVVMAANAGRLTAISGASFFPSSVKRAVLDFSNMTLLETTSMNGTWANDGVLTESPCGETDLAEWDLSGIQVVNTRGLGNTDAFGCLDLPSLIAVSNNGLQFCWKVTEMRLSAEKKTLEYLGNYGCRNWYTQAGPLRKVTIGGTDGFSFGTDVFQYQGNLEEVAFTGGVPTFKSDTAFPSRDEKTMWFSVPRNHAGWAAALEGHVAELSEDERKALWAAHPDKPIPFGVVDKTVFRTTNPQYVCYVDECAGPQLTLEHDEFFGDAVEVTSDWPANANGDYRYGTTLTLTPKPSANGTFAKWYGDVPGGASTDSPLTLVLTNDVWIYARFVHPWTLSSDRKTASNGNFTVNVSVLNESARTLTVGKAEASGLFADADVGQGVLDLGGPVTDTSGATWTFASFPSQWMLFTRQVNGKGDATAFFSPGTVAGEWKINQGATTGYGSYKGQQSYSLFVIDEPAAVGTIIGWSFNGQRNLTKFILRGPKFEELGGCAFWLNGMGTPLAETDFGWWNVSGMTRVLKNAFANTWTAGDGAGAFGTLKLPSMREAPAWSEWRYYTLGNLPNLTGYVLGGLKRSVTVTNVGERAFAYCPSLKAMTIHNAPGLTVGSLPFSGGATPAEITFTGKAIKDGGTAFGKLLGGVTAAATKPVVIYASSKNGWDATGYLDALTEDELAQVPAGETALGVYRGGAEAPLGKALVIDRSSPYEPRGAALIIR